MSKVKVEVEFDSAAEAANFLAAFGGNAGAAETESKGKGKRGKAAEAAPQATPQEAVATPIASVGAPVSAAAVDSPEVEAGKKKALLEQVRTIYSKGQAGGVAEPLLNTTISSQLGVLGKPTTKLSDLSVGELSKFVSMFEAHVLGTLVPKAAADKAATAGGAASFM